jgi:hypothetical protein
MGYNLHGIGNGQAAEKEIWPGMDLDIVCACAIGKFETIWRVFPADLTD